MKYYVYVTHPLYFRQEVEANSHEEALEMFDFGECEGQSDWKMRYSTYIETQSEDGIVEQHTFNDNVVSLCCELSEINPTQQGVDFPLYWGEDGFDTDSIREKFEELMSKIEKYNSTLSK